jgi:hypothetical protein
MGLNKSSPESLPRIYTQSSQGILKKQNYFTFNRDHITLAKILQKKIKFEK